MGTAGYDALGRNTAAMRHVVKGYSSCTEPAEVLKTLLQKRKKVTKTLDNSVVGGNSHGTAVPCEGKAGPWEAASDEGNLCRGDGFFACILSLHKYNETEEEGGAFSHQDDGNLFSSHHSSTLHCRTDSLSLLAHILQCVHLVPSTSFCPALPECYHPCLYCCVHRHSSSSHAKSTMTLPSKPPLLQRSVCCRCSGCWRC